MHAKNEVETLVPDLFLVFKKALYGKEASGQHLSFNMFWYSSIWSYNKNKLHKSSNCCSRGIVNFDFLEKGVGIVSPHHFPYDFLRKIFLMLYSKN